MSTNLTRKPVGLRTRRSILVRPFYAFLITAALLLVFAALVASLG